MRVSRGSNGRRADGARTTKLKKRDIKINHRRESETEREVNGTKDAGGIQRRNGANNNCYESAGREIIGQAICGPAGGRGRGDATELLLVVQR